METTQNLSLIVQAGFAGVLMFILGWGIPWLVGQFRGAHKESQEHVERVTTAYVADQKEARASEGDRHEVVVGKLDDILDVRVSDQQSIANLKAILAEQDKRNSTPK